MDPNVACCQHWFLVTVCLTTDHNKILHMPWQHCCHGMCKILLWQCYCKTMQCFVEIVLVLFQWHLNLGHHNFQWIVARQPIITVHMFFSNTGSVFDWQMRPMFNQSSALLMRVHFIYDTHARRPQWVYTVFCSTWVYTGKNQVSVIPANASAS